MKHIYIMILVFTIFLIYLDYRERYHSSLQVKENYCNKMDDSLNRTMDNKNSINLSKKQTNFTTNGPNPFLKCPQCHLSFDCSNYPYQIDDKYQTLCMTCHDKNSDTYKVLAKQPGRPRSCKNLY